MCMQFCFNLFATKINRYNNYEEKRMNLTPSPLSPQLQREWLIANGRGGYAMGALDGTCRQTHHALLVLPLRPPLQRVMLVRQLGEALFCDGQWRKLPTELEASASTLSPVRVEFFMEGVMPHFRLTYEEVSIRKYLWMPSNGPGLLVRYEMVGGPSTRLRVVPAVSFRDLDTGKLLAETYLVRTQPQGVLVYGDPNEKPCAISANRAGMLYPVNSWRTLPLFEALTNRWQNEEVYLPAAFEFELQAGKNVTLMLRLENATRLDQADETVNSEVIFAQALERQSEQTEALNRVFSFQPVRNLAATAAEFVVERATAMAQNGRTILAGYPRLTDWGRDAMIALPGLLLTTRRFELAKEVLTLFLKHSNHGVIPNYFSSRPEAPNYASLDATLWMFVAIYEYWQASQDRAYIAEIYPLLLEILQAHLRGATPGLKLDAEDGLLLSLERRQPMTWMNGQHDEWQATPRHGKAVEVQALWYNALRIMAEFSEALEKGEGFKRCSEYAERAGKSLAQKFWCEETQYLYDCLIDTSIINAGEVRLADNTASNSKSNSASRTSPNAVAIGDPALRPNQVIAVGLPFNIFSPEQTRAIIDIAVTKLVTPLGLRTLSPDHPAYCGEYTGAPKHLASAKHNGCAYPWLVLFLVRAFLRLYDNPRALYEMFEPLFGAAEKHCAGYLAEMYDGDAPHHPRGVPAYAASTGAILQSWHLMQEKT